MSADRRNSDLREIDLYEPVKQFLETQGYIVKGEVHDCDVVAVRGDEPPVIVELKTRLTLPLLLQAVDRLAITDAVYIAFADGSASKHVPLAKSSVWRSRHGDVLKLCRRLGLGVLVIRAARDKRMRVEPRLDPEPYAPRQDKRRGRRLLKEFFERVGDPNIGGGSRRKLMTAYRQDAIRCLDCIARNGEARVADIRNATGVDRTATMLQRDVYGWFERVARGVYRLSPKGQEALATYSDVIAAITEGAGASQSATAQASIARPAQVSVLAKKTAPRRGHRKRDTNAPMPTPEASGA